MDGKKCCFSQSISMKRWCRMDLPSGRKPSGHRYIKVELVLHVQELNFIFGVA